MLRPISIKLLDAMLNAGLISRISEHGEGNVIKFRPPLILTQQDVFITLDQVRSTLPLVRDGGIVVLYGDTKKETIFEAIDIDQLRRHEQQKTMCYENKAFQLIGSYGADANSFQQAIEWLAQGTLDVEKLITGTISLQELPLLLKKMMSERYFGKIIIRGDICE